jgi:pyruvate dehydrogenase E1 component alpha subunit
MNESEMLLLYKNMMRVRKMEELCAELYTQEKIRGFLHLYIGEEAVATGVMSLLGPEDNVIGTYREHGHALLKGIPAKSIFAEMFGKISGCSKGRGGSMHLFSSEHRFFGGCGIVASGIPHAVGLALAAKYSIEKRRTVCFFGEGAVAEGAFHESLNMAELWKIPVLFCCENNLYAMGTAIARSESQIDLMKKAQAYNIESQSVDGMNVLEVVEKTKQAFEFMALTGRPYFLEFKTFRFRPHSMFDPDLYRTKAEIENWKKRCPIDSFKNLLIGGKSLTKEIQAQIEQEIQFEMSEAIRFSEGSPFESLDDFLKEVSL